MSYYSAFFSLLWITTLHQIIGTASVVDGDTIEIRGQRIRLHGIDAPETSQWCTDQSEATIRCGQQAALALDSLLNKQTCRCEVVDTDRYGRAVATCYIGQTNINEWLVCKEWALAYRKYSEDYVSAEQQAWTGGRGIWQYKFTPPWEYRAQQHSAEHRKPSSPTNSNIPSQGTASSSGCKIKGNISRFGEKIYHLPESPWYNRTHIDEATGERWFCSEEEARQAGWRSAQQ